MKNIKFFRRGTLAVLCICSLSAAAAAPSQDVPKVSVAKAVEIRELRPAKYVGSITAYSSVDVVPRITGTILKVNFEDGALVKKGQLLYELEDTTYRAKLDSARAEREQIKAEIAFAETNYKRSSRLAATNAVSQSNLDEATRLLNTNKARLAAVEAAIRDAENNFSYTRIYSPLDGRIGENLYSAGNLVTPATGKLAHIVRLSPIYVKFSLSERTFRAYGGMKHFAERAHIRLRLADNKYYTENGKVGFIDNRIDPKTNTITIWAEFQNRDLELIPGGFATLLLSPRLAKPAAAVLQSALIVGDKECSVLVLDKENNVVRRVVKPGSTVGDYQEILSGVSAGEMVIIDGMHKVRPGGKAEPVPVKR